MHPKSLTKVSRRRFLKYGSASMLGLSGLAGLGIAPHLPKADASNPITDENAKAGTPSSTWFIDDPATYQKGPTSDDPATSNSEIRGYASATSVNKGSLINFYVSSLASSTYKADIYRLGWYAGNGARLVTTLGPFSCSTQAIPAPNTDGLVECNWSQSFSLNVPNDWVSGCYLVRLQRADNFVNYIPFVVRDDNANADILFQCSVMTYHSYNNVGGKSLYDYNSGSAKAVKISLDRPYRFEGAGDLFFKGEYALIRFLESSGYNISYCTDIDTHVNPRLLLSHKGFLIVGHDEYWTREMYNNVKTARDMGVNLAFFSGNSIYWQVRLEPSSSGVPNRIITCYKSAANDGTANPNVPSIKLTDEFRKIASPAVPEDELMGVRWDNYTNYGEAFDYVVTNTNHPVYSWVFANTGFTNGSKVKNLVGYEWDKLYNDASQPSGIVKLAESPATGKYPTSGIATKSNSAIYTAASGAYVFAAGTMYWGYGCDYFNGPDRSNDGIKQTTRNIIERYISTNGAPISRSLVVTATSDDGSGETVGTLSYALKFVRAGQAIELIPNSGNTITLTGLGITIPKGAILDGGNCANPVVIDGSAVNGDGVTLQGNVTLRDVAIIHFRGRQIVTAGTGNTLSCVRTQK